jgi:spore maturation protein SpmB
MLGRIGALFFAMDSLAAVIGALGAPALVTALGLTAALNTTSAFALFAAPVTWEFSTTFSATASSPANDTANQPRGNP